MSYLIRALADGKVEGVYASRPYATARLAHLNRTGYRYTVESVSAWRDCWSA